MPDENRNEANRRRSRIPLSNSIYEWIQGMDNEAKVFSVLFAVIAAVIICIGIVIGSYYAHRNTLRCYGVKEIDHKVISYSLCDGTMTELTK